VDNELDAASCREVEAHIQDCVKCNVCLETLRRTIEICKKMEDKPVPDLFSRRLRELIQSLQ
jgi:anti-sigma factor RsiW